MLPRTGRAGAQELAVCREREAGAGRSPNPAGPEHFAHGAGSRGAGRQAAARPLWGAEASPVVLCVHGPVGALTTGAGGPLGAGWTIPRMSPQKGTNTLYSTVRSLRPIILLHLECGCLRRSRQCHTPIPHTAHSGAHGHPCGHHPGQGSLCGPRQSRTAGGEAALSSTVRGTRTPPPAAATATVRPTQPGHRPRAPPCPPHSRALGF